MQLGEVCASDTWGFRWVQRQESWAPGVPRCPPLNSLHLSGRGFSAVCQERVTSRFLAVGAAGWGLTPWVLQILPFAVCDDVKIGGKLCIRLNEAQKKPFQIIVHYQVCIHLISLHTDIIQLN